MCADFVGARIVEKGVVSMKVQEALAEVRDAMTAERVYGEPYDHDGVTIIPAAAVRGGGGGGGGDDGSGKGGAGFGLRMTPKGAWVIDGENVTWKPAVDVNRVILGGQLVGIVALLTVREIVKLQAAKRTTRAPRWMPRARKPSILLRARRPKRRFALMCAGR